MDEINNKKLAEMILYSTDSIDNKSLLASKLEKFALDTNSELLKTSNLSKGMDRRLFDMTSLSREYQGTNDLLVMKYSTWSKIDPFTKKRLQENLNMSLGPIVIFSKIEFDEKFIELFSPVVNETYMFVNYAIEEGKTGLIMFRLDGPDPCDGLSDNKLRKLKLELEPITLATYYVHGKSTMIRRPYGSIQEEDTTTEQDS